MECSINSQDNRREDPTKRALFPNALAPGHKTILQLAWCQNKINANLFYDNNAREKIAKAKISVFDIAASAQQFKDIRLIRKQLFWVRVGQKPSLTWLNLCFHSSFYGVCKPYTLRHLTTEHGPGQFSTLKGKFLQDRQLSRWQYFHSFKKALTPKPLARGIKAGRICQKATWAVRARH